MNRIPLNIDCRENADEVKHLRECGKWKSRSYDFPFYTLGVSAYLKGKNENRNGQNKSVGKRRSSKR